MINEESIVNMLGLTGGNRHILSMRHSKRAKRLIFKSSVKEGLEIVLPRRYDDRWVEDVLDKRKSWILKRISELRSERMLLRPREIVLESIGSRWTIFYRTTGSEVVEETGKGKLEVTPDSTDVFSTSRVLQQWLQLRAVDHLPPLLQERAGVLGFSYNKATVRGQKTRWGSCSEKRNISLNRNLLFMPPEVVKYVIDHELTHLRVLDHSPKFWKELERVLPGAQLKRRELRSLEKTVVPTWASV
ncbi:M48 family metallopeptidase [Dehalococcoidia bacterium]|nr:M48 family metallopeptidase [Dehalococcoidia bacterium]